VRFGFRVLAWPSPSGLDQLPADERNTARSARSRQPAPPGTEQAPDFLTATQFAARLGVSRETVRRLAIAARCRTPWCAAVLG
jgi:hypothetical protein